jgi:hypothetical protein
MEINNKLLTQIVFDRIRDQLPNEPDIMNNSELVNNLLAEEYRRTLQANPELLFLIQEEEDEEDDDETE